MPIQVQGPDGQEYEFPDGTSREVMKVALAKRYGGPAASGSGNPQVKRVQFPDGSVRRVQAPAGASDAEILAYARSQFQPAQQEQGPWTQYQQDGQQSAPRSRTYEVTGPDGRAFEVTAPHGATQDEVLSYAMANAPQAGGNTTGDRVQDPASVVWDQPDPSQVQWDNGEPSGAQARAGSRLSDIERALRAADAAGNVEDARRLATAYVQERDSQGGRGNSTNPREELSALRRMAELEAKARAIPDFSNVRGSSGPTVQQKPFAQYTGPLLAGKAPTQRGPTLDQINASNRAMRSAAGYAAERQAIEARNKRVAFKALPAPIRGAIGAGQRVDQAGRGIGQGVAWLMDQAAPRGGQSPSRYDDALVSEAEARQRDAYLKGDTAAAVGGFVGDVGLTMLPAGALSRLKGVRGVLGSAALGAGYAGLQPVVEGESRGGNATMGAAFGAGGQVAGLGLSTLGRNAAKAVPADVRAMVSRATAMGIPVHASQVSQSLPVKVAASAGKYLPFSGYAKAAGAQQTGINRAVAKTFGANAPKLTDDVMLQARQRLSRGFEDVYNRNSVPITPNAARKLARVEQQAMRRLTRDDGEVLRNQLDDILANANNGVLSGQKYQAVRTALKKAEGPDKLGQAVKELRLSLDDIAADAVGPQDAAKLKELRSHWANFRTAESALKQNAGAGGDIRPAALWPLVKKGSTREMRELARMGQTLLKDPISDSGTAQRTLAYNLLMGGGSMANPALIPMFAKASLGGATLGRMANSSGLAQLLARDNRGAAATGLGGLLEGAYPYVASALAAQQLEESRR